ncbi:MAG: tetratricopeptide repeat protein [Cyanobacteria bacterium RUI128]|nr:tetratricopeptide repeat protein [Cyanobacteria bacterium RUI128]
MKKSMIEAFELKRKGYYKQAIEIYYKLLSKENDNVEILSELADLYYLLHNNERAKHYVSKAFDIVPRHVGCMNVLKNIYLFEKDYEQAEDIAKEIYDITQSESDLPELLKILEMRGKYEDITLYSNDVSCPKCMYMMANAYYKLKNYEKATELLKKVEADVDTEKSDNEQVLILLANIYHDQNDTEKTKEVFKKLEMNNVETAEGLNFVGLDKLDGLKTDEAIEYFSKAIELDDKTAKYHYNMGQAYFLKGWFEEAEKCFNTAICLDPMEERYHYSLAYLFYKSGDFNAAEAHLNPEYFDSKVLLQVIKSEKGDLAAPKAELEKMLKEYPDNETILYSLAKIYYNLDLYKQAKTRIEDTLKVNPKPFEYQTFYVRLLLKLDMTADAEAKINEMLEKYPKFYYAKVLEAELYLAKKEYDDLFETAQELIELDINHYEGYYYNALALFEKEDVNFAIESLKKAISLDVMNADLYVKMSEFYQAIGRYEDAFAYIKEASDIDKSAKNQELYMQLAGILRRKGISQDQV